MAIMMNKKRNALEYKIPQDIKDRIPDYFYFAMAGELFSVAGYDKGIDMFQDDNNYDSSTNGWKQAFRMTCRKLDMEWLYEYWNTLEWYDSDIFDSEIELEIFNKFKKGRPNTANCYYKYLVETEKVC